MTKDLIIVAILILIIGSAMTYIIRAKKRGVKCIGCSAGSKCPGCSSNTSCGGCQSCNTEK